MEVNCKKQDALEFVKSLEGCWDCIIWDPPYLINDKRSTFRNSYLSHIKEERIRININYLDKLLENIKTKTNSFILISFSNKPDCNSNKILGWLRMMNRGSIRGDKVISNLEYINIKFYNISPIYSPLIYQISYYGDNHGGAIKNNIKQIAFSKPIDLFKDLFKWLNVKYILDPFAGSYNSVKAAKQLNIRIDACDKYIDPPSILRKDLLSFIN